MHKILPTHITALHTGEFSISKFMHTDKTKAAKKRHTCWSWLHVALCFREGMSQRDRRPEKWMTASRVPSGLRLMRNTPSWTSQKQTPLFLNQQNVCYILPFKLLILTEGNERKRSVFLPFHLHVCKRIWSWGSWNLSSDSIRHREEMTMSFCVCVLDIDMNNLCTDMRVVSLPDWHCPHS